MTSSLPNAQRTDADRLSPTCMACAVRDASMGALCDTCAAHLYTDDDVVAPGQVSTTAEAGSGSWLVDRWGRLHPLASNTVLGRHSPSFRILHKSISKQHAQITYDGHSWSIQDLSSKNGVWHQDDRISGTRPLKSGDKVRIGNVAFLFLRAEIQSVLTIVDATQPMTAELLEQHPEIAPPAPPASKRSKFLVRGDDLNAYGTLFGGVLISLIEERSAAFGATLFGGRKPSSLAIQDLLFQSPVREGDHIHLAFEFLSQRDGSLELSCSILCESTQVATCNVSMNIQDSEIERPVTDSGWQMLSNHWVIGEDTQANGNLKVRKMTGLIDAAAVIYCRQVSGLQRVVTRKLSHETLSHAQSNDVVELWFQTIRVGRTSIAVECIVVIQTTQDSGDRGGRLLARSTLLMVTTDSDGKPLAHGIQA